MSEFKFQAPPRDNDDERSRDALELMSFLDGIARDKEAKIIEALEWAGWIIMDLHQCRCLNGDLLGDIRNEQRVNDPYFLAVKGALLTGMERWTPLDHLPMRLGGTGVFE